MTTTVTKVPDAVARSTRGLGQGGVGWVIVEAIEAFNIFDFNDKQYGLAVVIVGTVVSYLQNLIENKLGVGILRTVPAKDEPVVTLNDEPQEPDEELALNPAHEEDEDPLEHVGEDVEEFFEAHREGK